jgi:thiamine biosynthesis lipoprotein
MKKLIFSAALLALIISAVFLNFRYRQTAFIAVDGFTQGTTYHIIVREPLRTLLAGRHTVTKEEVDSLLHRFDLSLSTYVPLSVISRINHNDPAVRTDSLFNVCYRASERIWRETGGAFDITVGPLVDAWGFGPEGPEPVDSSIIDSLLQVVGMEKVRLEGDRVIKSDPRIRLDVNAIAQGLSVDVVADYLEGKGVRSYLVEIGGELKARGQKSPGNPWKVGVDKPIDNNNIPGARLQVVLKLKDRALATSGNYRKFYEKDGVKYGHEIDPHTGCPARNRLLSVTVLAGECMWADGYATAFMVMGLEKSKAFVEARDDLDAYFVYSDEEGNFKTSYTHGFDRMIVR